MATGPAATFQLLARTDNQAADALLVAALGSTAATVRAAAVRAALERRSRGVLVEVVRRTDEFDDAVSAVVRELPGRLWQTMREFVLGGDPKEVAVACRAAVRFHEYELIPTLIAVLEESGNPNADLAGRTLVELSEVLYHDLATTRDERRRHDPQAAKRHALAALEPSAQRYEKHRRLEVIEAFLQLAPRDNAVLLRILCDARDAAFVPMQQVLAVDERPGVLRLLLGYLEDPTPPWSVTAALFRRTDRRCIESLLKRIGAEPSPSVRANLRRIETIAWLDDETLVASLDDARLQALVRLTTAAGLKPERALEVLLKLARGGSPVGRRAALEALADRRGVAVNERILRSLADPDAGVRAAALRQLRPRGIPGALTTLIEALDDPADEVRDAARANLEEFSFRRFHAAYELLDEDVRRTTAGLVRRVDPASAARLRDEMRSAQGKRRMRALEIVAAMELTAELLPVVLECADDGDHLVRAEAAKALGAVDGDEVRTALVGLTADSSFAVRDAAAESLRQAEVRAGRNAGPSAPLAASSAGGVADVTPSPIGREAMHVG